MSRYITIYRPWFLTSEHTLCLDFAEPETQRANCTTGSVRLADPTFTASSLEGRVEVCINQAWGTVCNSRFDQEDAGTVCVAAGGFLRNGK